MRGNSHIINEIGICETTGILPSRPDSSEADAQKPIHALHCWSWMFPFEHSDLLAQREHFERSIGAAAEESPARCEQHE